MILGSGGGSSGSTSAAPKPTSDDLAGVTDAGARSAEEMADSMLLDSPLPDAEKEEQKRQEEIPIGEPIVPPPPNLDLLQFARPFYSKNFSLGPQNKEDPMGKVVGTPDVEASLVVGAIASITPFRGCPSTGDKDQACTREH